MQPNVKHLALRVTLTYVIVAGCWILFSDEFVGIFVTDPEKRVSLSIIKGWGFVAVTGVILYQMTLRSFKLLQRTAQRRREAEAAQHESENRYRRLFEAESDAVMTVDLQTGQILDANPAAELMYGYSREELLRLKATDLSTEPGKTGHAIANSEKHIPLRMHRRKNGTVFPVEISCSEYVHENRKIHVAAIRDITQRQLAKQALETSEQQFRDLFENMNEGFAHCRMIFEDGQPRDIEYLTVNKKFYEISGLKDVIGKRITELVPGVYERDREAFEIYGRVAATGKPEKFERFNRTLQQWLAASVYSTQKGFFVVLMDVITERKQADELLKKKLALQEQLSSITQTVPGVIYSFLMRPDGSTCFPYSSPAIREQFGFDPEELAKDGSMIFARMHPEDLKRVQADIMESARTLKTWWGEFRYQHPSRGEIWVSGRSEPKALPDGSILWQGFTMDATERKQAEDSLRASEEKFSSMFSSSPVATSLSTMKDGRYLNVNDAFLKLFQRTREEVVGHTVFDLNMWVDQEQRTKLFARLKEFGAVHSYEMSLRAKSGQIIEILWSGALVTFGGESCLLGSALDITERKRMSEALQREKDFLNTLLENIPAQVFWKDNQLRYLGCNKLFAADAGLALPADIVGKTDFDLSWRESAEIYRADDRQVMASKTPKLDYEEPQTRPDGDTLWLRTSKTPLVNGHGEVLGLLGIYTDITERKNTELALRRSEEQLSFALKTSGIGAWVLDLQTHKVTRTLIHARIFGYESNLSDWSLEIFLEHILPEDRAEVARRIREAMAAFSDWNFECRIRRHDGAIRWIFAAGGHEKNSEGKPVRGSGIVQDITERKIAEVELAKSEQKLRSIIDVSPLPIALNDEDLNIPYLNPAFVETFGYTIEDIPTVAAWWPKAYPDPEYRATVQAIWVARLEEARQNHGKFREMEVTVRCKNGTDRTVIAKAAALTGAFEEQHLVVFIDITERKLSEQALEQSHSLLNATLESTADGILVVDMDGKVSSFNQKFLQLWQVPPPLVETHDDRRLLDYAIAQVADPAAFLTRVEHLYHRPEESSWDEVLFRDGRVFERYSQPQRIGNKIAGRVWSFHDITERKRTEKQDRAFAKLSDRLSVSTDPDDAARAVIATAEELFNWDACFLLRYDAASDTVRELINQDTVNGQRVNVPIAAGVLHPTPMLRRVIEQGGQMVLRQDETDNQTKMQRFGDLNRISLSLLFVPLRHRGQVTGFLSVQSYRPNAYNLKDLAALQTLADQCAGAIARVEAESAMRSSEERLRFVTENAHVGLVVVSRDRRYTFANAAYVEILGLPSPEIVGLHVAEVLAPLYEEQIRARLDLAFTGERVSYELRKPSGGVVRYYTVTYEPNLTDGIVSAVVVVITDITERKQAEEKMARLATAVDHAAEAIVITDVGGTIQYVNPAFERVTGYTSAEVIGKNPRILKSGKQDAEFYLRLWATLKRGEIWSGRFVNRHKNGTFFEEEATISPIRDASGKTINYVAVKRDVTRESQLESQFHQAQKMEAIGTLAGGIAHDFNNILAAMFGYGYLLQSDCEGNASATESISEILKAATRAKDLVQQILTFSRQREQKRQIIRINTVVKEALKFMRASLPSGIKIETKLHPDTPPVLADPSQIYQIVLNLATNAFHAMEGKQGSLNVSLQPFTADAEFRARHPDLKSDNWVRLTVADTGHGMKPEVLEHIFEPFYTTKPVGKGTGLGLSVVHGIIQTHDGIIEVGSALGSGTSFNIYFPARNEEQHPSATESHSLPRGNNQRILVVDDEAAITTVFNKLLTRLNYQVTTANSPVAALELFSREARAFDLVITDLTMPDMSGLDLAAKIREADARIPIVLASGQTTAVTTARLAQSGVTTLIEKPVANTALARTVNQLLSPPKP